MDPVRIVQFTDTHLFGAAGDTLRGIATQATLRATLRHAARHIAAADALLVSGDLVQDDPAGYRPFHDTFSQLGKPVLTLPGNHDDPDAMRAALSAAPFQYCGHRDFAHWRIVMVDSVIAGAAGGRVGAGALQVLRESLTSAGQRHVLVCLHHHPVAMRSRWLDTVGLENAQDFFAVLDEHPRLRAVLWGHVHQSYDALRRGVRLLATPSTCAQFLPFADDFAIDSRPPAYRILELTADGAVNTEVLWVDTPSTGALTPE
jgi:Icc protein